MAGTLAPVSRYNRAGVLNPAEYTGDTAPDFREVVTILAQGRGNATGNKQSAAQHRSADRGPGGTRAELINAYMDAKAAVRGVAPPELKVTVEEMDPDALERALRDDAKR